jgi:HSP20 family protein
MSPLSEIGDFADELRRLFVETGGLDSEASLTADCSPPLDVYETDETLEITVDVPGVDPRALRLVVKGNALLIAGQKMARRGRGSSSFHLVERGYGRFARAVRLATPCDTARTRATLTDGELRLVVPKISERRGRAIRIPISAPAERA